MLGFGSVVLIRPTLRICCNVSLCGVIFDRLLFPSHFGRLAAVFYCSYAFSTTPSKWKWMHTACRIMTWERIGKVPPIHTHIHTLHVMVMLPAGAVLHQHTTQSQIVFLLICWHFYNRTLLRFDLIVDLCWTYRDRYTARYQKQLDIMSIFQFFFNWPAPGDWGWFYTGAKKKKQEKTLFLFSCFH